MTQTILHIDASARTENSISRDLSARIVKRFKQADIVHRDLATPLPLITGEWVGANFTPAGDRDAVQRDTLALSDQLVAEIKAADVIVIGTPIYNFAVPAVLKAWIDLIARAGVTFEYTAKPASVSSSPSPQAAPRLVQTSTLPQVTCAT